MHISTMLCASSSLLSSESPTLWRRADKSRQAFTLVELLVVIGIIALLISILLPAMNQARRASNKTACLSNLRQVGLGMQIYLQESKGAVPRYWIGGAQPRMWHQLLIESGSVGSGQVFFCPERVPAPVIAPATTEVESSVAQGTISYGLNLHLSFSFDKVSGATTSISTRINQIKRPSEKILIVDAYNTPAEPWGIYYAYPYNRSVGGIALARHYKNACNVLWVDGHASPVSSEPGLLYARTALTSYAHTPNSWEIE